MALTDMNDMLAHAYRHGYAVGAFAIRDLESLTGVIAAAEASRAPVLLVPEVADGMQLEVLLPAVESAASRAEVPVAIQAAVSSDPEAAARLIRLGCNGLRVRELGDSFPQSVQQVSEVVATAHACGLSVEAEPGAHLVTTPAEAERFVDRSGIDSLRLDLGDGEDSGKGKLDHARLKRIHKALGAPLSVDAGEGLSENQYLRLIRNGVAAIGYSAPVPITAAEAESVMRIWGAAGRAAEVLAQCTPWETAEQILLYNFPELPEADTETALARGERVLRRIPGVREAVGMRANLDEAPYHFAWRVRLCHPKALSSFQHHPDHAAFTNGAIHPAIEGCTRIQFSRTDTDKRTSPDPPEPPGQEAVANKVTPLPPGTRRNLA
ncbi:class II fructose-bisphosphate aldolase [Thiohalorhabdus sp. Cl-TMA]|uniref:Class II fructose-bisphosphate aldolase n=1 Tax=Thiohalorhabdus methylotrophus TaxID=3242694 RepID=A0ABV4TTT8_9GAMM